MLYLRGWLKRYNGDFIVSIHEAFLLSKQQKEYDNAGK